MRQLKIQKSITNRSSEALDKYLVEIGRAPLISIDEEIELAQKIKKGGPEGERAKDKLVTANLRFVVSVAKQYQHQGLTLTDLIDEGNIGLIKAAQKFDETRGFKFISYAVWWIRQSILQAIAEQSRIVRLPLNQVGSLNKISKALSKFEQDNERRPSPEELAEVLDIPVDKIADTLKVSGRHISVDAPFVDGEDNSLLDVLVNDDSPMADKTLVNESLSKEIDRQIQLALKEEKAKTPDKVQSPEDIKLSGTFESNKGRLPMPITGAYLVVGEYGVQNVAGMKDVKQNNLGLDIQGQDGAQAGAVYDGTVSSIFQQGKGQIGVLIRHGSYISVYCNLSETRLKKGDKVKTGDIVGNIQTSENGTPILHFQLHKESTRLNPSDWLRR